MPVDGVIVLGNGLCNESMLTGESAPVKKEIGSKVFGGTMLTVGSIVVKVNKLGEFSAISQILKLEENAQNAKAPI